MHLRENALYTRWEVKHYRLFFIFLAARLGNLGSQSLNFSNALNTEKQM